MTDAISAFGVQLKLGDGATPTEAFTAIAEVLDVSGPSLTRSTADVTSHGSTEAWEEIIATIKRSGEITFDINYVPTNATHDATDGLLAELAEATDASNWQLVFPDSGSTTWSFAALVTAFSPANPVDGAQKASVTLKPTGKPTLA